MITEFMTLTTRRDAYQWASEMGDLTDAQIERLGDWIWDKAPHPRCTLAEHPISNIDTDAMFEIAGDDNHDDYAAALETKCGTVKFSGKTYALTRQADLTNRVFHGWFGDANEDGEYTVEYSAPAVGQDGTEVTVYWQFDEVKGEEMEPSDYDWDNVSHIRA